jgi:hypothetical protein
VANESLVAQLGAVVVSGRGAYASLLGLSRALQLCGESKKTNEALVLTLSKIVIESVANNSAVSGEGQAWTAEPSLNNYLSASYDELASLAR